MGHGVEAEKVNGGVVMPSALHIALWNGNLQQIEDALAEGAQAVERKDARGNRGLHLALKFAHRHAAEIVKKLLDAGARVRSRDQDGWKTVHHAIATNNEDIVRMLIIKEKQQAPPLLAKKLDEICPSLEDVPDFYSELHIEIATWIPGAGRWLPSDTVKIWKRGRNIRFDVTLVGFENGKWRRGNLSFILLGKEKTFLCLDHDDKTTTNLLSPNVNLEEDEVERVLHFYMTSTISTTQMDAKGATFKRKKAWVTKSDVNEDLGKWKNTRVYDMKGLEASYQIRQAQNKDRQLQQPDSTTAPDSEKVVPASQDANEATSILSQIAEAVAEVTVEPKSNYVVSLEMAKDEKVEWGFSTEQCDIAFGVRFLEDVDGDRWSEVVPLNRVNSHRQPQNGSYCAPREGTVVFTWDNSYSVFRPKKLKFSIRPENDVADEHWAPNSGKEELTSFKQWFGVEIEDLPDELRAMHPKHSIMVHTSPPCRRISKKFSATVHMSDEFPVSVHQFLPVAKVLANAAAPFERVKDFLTSELAKGFPVQFSIPIMPSVSANFRYECMELTTPPGHLFAIPSSYSMFDEDVLSPRMHQEMLNRLPPTA